MKIRRLYPHPLTLLCPLLLLPSTHRFPLLTFLLIPSFPPLLLLHVLFLIPSFSSSSTSSYRFSTSSFPPFNLFPFQPKQENERARIVVVVKLMVTSEPFWNYEPVWNSEANLLFFLFCHEALNHCERAGFNR